MLTNLKFFVCIKPYAAKKLYFSTHYNMFSQTKLDFDPKKIQNKCSF